jgi:hypothetical protein
MGTLNFCAWILLNLCKIAVLYNEKYILNSHDIAIPHSNMIEKLYIPRDIYHEDILSLCWHTRLLHHIQLSTQLCGCLVQVLAKMLDYVSDFVLGMRLGLHLVELVTL